MISRHQRFEKDLHQLFDFLLMMFCLYLAHTVRRHLGMELNLRRSIMFRDYAWLAFAVGFIGHYCLQAQGFYQHQFAQKPTHQLWTATRAMSLCVLLVLAGLYILDEQRINRSAIFIFGASASLMLWMFDLAWQALLTNSAALRPERRLVVLVGSPSENAEILKQINLHPEWRMKVVTEINLIQHSVADLTTLLNNQPIDLVMFTSGKSCLKEVETAILACEVEGVEAWLMADFVRTSITRPSMDEWMSKPVMVFRSGPDVSWPLLCKGVFDRIAALILLVTLFIPMLLIALLIKLTSRGPAIFSQERSGLRGRVFTMLKFRSMVSDAEQHQAELAVQNEMHGPVFKITEDPRVTPLGKWLRRTSLDELPQLINVLKGEMSLVGPRPLPVYEIKQFTDPWQRRRLSMKPGMTCLWQIAGRNKIGFEEWMRLDLLYIDSWSFWLDLKILLKTIPVVLSGKGAH